MTKRKIMLLDREKAPVFYTNSVQIIRSNFDFRFQAGMIESASPGELVVRVTAQLMMSPQHTKAFANALVQQVQRYEESFGPIVLEPAVNDKQDENEEEG